MESMKFQKKISRIAPSSKPWTMVVDTHAVAATLLPIVLAVLTTGVLCALARLFKDGIRLPPLAGIVLVALTTWPILKRLESGSGLVLFDLHVLSFSAAAMHLLNEGITSIQRRRVSKGATPVQMAQFHAAFQVATAGLFLCGLAAIYFNKEAMGKPHGESVHAKVGFAAVILMMLNVTFGSLRSLRAFPKLQFLWQDQNHRIFGKLAYLIASSAAALGVVSGWGMKNLGESLAYGVAASVLTIAGYNAFMVKL
eukprot:scaffold470_cov257-Pinguiococcus_pyrenoidosus.AAC.35